ncbi:MAG: porin family protein [Candidatus Eiseniibacteriota bacterium]|nr:MAG: porin family protein [Candidatus Eisenbacteria bacterium]
MKKFLALLTVPLALVLCAAPGFAQMEMGGPMWAFGANVGYALPMGDFGDAYDGAISAGVTGCYMFNEQYGLELGVDWNKFSANDDLMDALQALDPGVEDMTMQIIPVMLDFVGTFPAGDLMLYAKGGIGMYFMTLECTCDGDSDTESESEFGMNGGVGLKVPIAETTMFTVGVAFHHILTEDESTQYFGINAGVGFLF